MKLRKVLAMALAMLMLVSTVPIFGDSAQAASLPYYIEVDLTNQIVTIFKNDKSKAVVRQMLCSAGEKDSTPTGTYSLPPKKEENERKKWYYFGGFHVYAMYATRVYKGIMFHSIPCNKKSLATVGKRDLAKFGKPASHGCIRLLWQDAMFIALNCGVGTKVKIYKSGKRDEDLRALLKQSSYTGENGQSYKSFLGIPDVEGVMGRFSKGQDVKELQMRLRDLGIYSEKVDGDYRGSTVTAVRKAQKMLGMEQTGIADLDFQAAIYSGDAPADLNVGFREGMSGPAIRNMQQYLADLGMYASDIDGIYDVDVVNAVKLFQSCYGFDVNGAASSLVQKAICYEAGRVKAIFAMEEHYNCETLTDYLYFGKVKCKVGIRLRSKPNAKSSALLSMSDGDTVVALEHGDEWSKVQRGSKVGFVMNQYMSYSRQAITAMRYTSDSGEVTFTLGYAKEDYYNGATLPAEAFANYLAGGGELDAYKGMAEYATVTTESEDVTLNLREQPNTTSQILAELSQGTQVKVSLHSDEWSLVNFQGQEGYLLNDYLEFFQAPEADMDAELNMVEEDDDEDYDLEGTQTVDDIQYAVVSAASGKSAAVYSEGSMDAEILGSLKNGVQLTVVESFDGWNKITIKGHEGYMMDEDLQFVQAA